MSANFTPPIQYYGQGGSFTDQSGSATYVQPNPFLYVTTPGGLTFPTGPQILANPRRVSFAANTLGQTAQSFTTPNYQDLNDLADFFSDLGYSYTIDEGPVHTMVVTVPFDTITDEDFYETLYDSTQWELIPNTGQKSLLYAGILADSFDLPGTDNTIVLPVAIQGAMANALANNLPAFTVPTNNPAIAAAYASCSAAANQIFQYLRAGIEGVPSYTQTLKRTAVVDVNNRVGAFQLSIDQQTQFAQTSGSYNYLMATADLVAQYEITPTVAAFMLPAYSKVYGIVGIDPYTYSVYAAWLIKPVSAQFIGQNKVQLTQEFVWDEWASGLYTILSDPEKFPVIYNATSALNSA
jgi:hypothetical protein